MVLACFALVSMTVNAQLAKIALMHDGNATMYDADQTAAAIDAAVDGDVLYFTEGSFAGNITIEKRISLVGAGEGTVIGGKITIRLGDNDKTMPAHMLDALCLRDNKGNYCDIALSSKTDGLHIRKCHFGSLTLPTSAAYTQSNFEIDRCYIEGTLRFTSIIKSLAAVNCKIKYLQGNAAMATAATLTNCNIWHVSNTTNTYSLLATLVNCIIGAYESTSYMQKDCVLKNCIVSDAFSSLQTSDHCYNVSSLAMNNETIEVIFPSLADMQESNYFGTDGTLVGITGGTTPFTLVPAAPRITESSIKVDPESRKLNVNIKVTAN